MSSGPQYTNLTAMGGTGPMRSTVPWVFYAKILAVLISDRITKLSLLSWPIMFVLKIER